MKFTNYIVVIIIIIMVFYSCSGNDENKFSNGHVVLSDEKIDYFLPNEFTSSKIDTTSMKMFYYLDKLHYSADRNIKFGIYYSLSKIYDSAKLPDLDTTLHNMFYDIVPSDNGDVYTGKIIIVNSVKYIVIHETLHKKNYSKDLMVTNEHLNGKLFYVIIENNNCYTSDTISYNQMVDSIFSSIKLSK